MSAELEAFAQTDFEHAPARVKQSGLITKWHKPVLVADVEDIVQNIFDAQPYPCALQEGQAFDQLCLLVQIDKSERVERRQIAEMQITATEKSAAIDGGATPVVALEAKPYALVKYPTRQFELMPCRATIAAGG